MICPRFSHLSDLYFSQYAKNKAGVGLLISGLISGFSLGAGFNDFFDGKHKKLIPQNVVSTHPSNILHIEIIFCNPF